MYVRGGDGDVGNGVSDKKENDEILEEEKKEEEKKKRVTSCHPAFDHEISNEEGRASGSRVRARAQKGQRGAGRGTYAS